MHLQAAVGRAAFGRLAVLLSSGAVFLPPPESASAAVKLSNGMEEIRKAASLIPGYGPPDIAFPAAFRGRWRVQNRVVDVKAPLGEEAAPAAALLAARELMTAEKPLLYEARFLATESGGISITNDKAGGVALSANAYSGPVIADRAFNAEQRAAALPRAFPLQDYEARWDATNPNVLTLACRGSLVETKVTKRSFDSPFEGAFSTSEYARIADAGSEGVMSSVPQILAQRVQTKYKWDATADGVLRQIEALELASTFDPTATGFADLAGATPVLTVKSRVVLTRE